MGGFVSGLARTATDAISKVASVAQEHIGSVDHVFERTDEGKLFLNDYKNIYQPTKAQLVETLSKKALTTAQADPAKPKVDLGQIHSDASKAARQALLGPKDALGVTLAASIEKKHGLAAAQSFSNGVAFLLKDYVNPADATTVKGALVKGGEPYSSFKRNVRAGGVAVDSSPSYTPPGKIERAVTGAIYQTFSPLMVVPHIATLANGMFGSSPMEFLQGVAKASTKGLHAGIDDYQNLLTTGAFTESMMRDVKAWNLMKATGHPQIMDSPLAQIVYKSFHQPGFGPWRDYNLLSGANVGKSVAEQLGRDLHSKGVTPKLQWQAMQFGLDPQKIIASGGKLEQVDLERAVYKFVNEHYFLDNSLSRSQLLQSTWAGRILGTYHGYVTRQSKLMARAMFQNFKERGAASVVKNLAIGATLMPLMGEGIKLIQETYRGQNAGGTLKTDIENIEGRHGAEGFAESYFGAMSHVGAYGVYGHIIRGALTHNILNTLGGPVVSSTADLVQDTIGASRRVYRKKGKEVQKSFEPVERDLMFDTPGVSLLAQVLAHRVLPNAKDNPHKDPIRQLYHHVRGEDDYGNPIEGDSNESKK